MNYDNLSPALAMMVVQLAYPGTFRKIVQETQQRLSKELKRTHRKRLK